MSSTLFIMRYLVAFLCPPLALILCGRLLGAIVNVMLLLVPLVVLLGSLGLMAVTGSELGLLTAFGSVPLAGVCGLLALVHSFLTCERWYRAERRREMNLMLAAQGHKRLPEINMGWPMWVQLPFVGCAVMIVLFAGREMMRVHERVTAARDEIKAKERASIPSPPAVFTTEQQQERDAGALLAMEGKSLADVEGTHGAALSKDKETGWAEWQKFRARFENGKVVEVNVK